MLILSTVSTIALAFLRVPINTESSNSPVMTNPKLSLEKEKEKEEMDFLKPEADNSKNN